MKKAAEEEENNRSWLLSELPKLLREGIITPAEAERLSSYYSSASEPQSRKGGSPFQRYFLLALVIVGVLHICGGIILLFAYNWEQLPRAVRTAVAFVPLAFASATGFYTIWYKKDARWREASALLTSAAFAALFALLSQIYGLRSSPGAYMELLLALSIPLVYIFSSSALAGLCSLGLFALLGGDIAFLTRITFLAALVPFFLLRAGRQKEEWTDWSGWLSLLLIAFFALSSDRNLSLNIIMTVFALFETGLALRSRDEGAITPWLVAGAAAAVFLMTFGALNDYLWGLRISDSASIWPRLKGLWPIPFLLCLTLALKRKTLFSLFLLIFPLLALLSHFALLPAATLYLMAGLCAFSFGLLLLFYGFRARELLIINLGTAQLLWLFLAKFFDSAIGILPRAIAAIITGLLFIAMNLLLSRRFKTAARADSERPSDE